METVKVEMKTFRIKLYCECGGEIKFTGGMDTYEPITYVHRCEKCNEIEHLFKQYPYFEYEEIPLERNKLDEEYKEFKMHL